MKVTHSGGVWRYIIVWRWQRLYSWYLCIKFWNWAQEETSAVVILRHTYLGSFVLDPKDVLEFKVWGQSRTSFKEQGSHYLDISLRGTKALSKPTGIRTVKVSTPLFIRYHSTPSLEISEQGNALILAICRIEWCSILCVYFEQ